MLLGKPLATKAIAHERLSNMQGLAIFGSDPLSSTAYATEEILLVLAVAGIGVTFSIVPIALVIILLIFLISFSYRQAIYAYPQGGGVYNVARENLGETPALVGAASLIIDYILTAAVSVTAGVAAVTSAVPELYSYRVIIGVAVIIILAWANLRGVRESGKLFSTPTYAFIVTILGMIGYGLWRYMSGSFPEVEMTHASSVAGTSAIGFFLLLRAFSGGCTALTGIEAISNGVKAFKTPEPKNAARTLIGMAFMLGIIFFGITLLAYLLGIVPLYEETVVSQIARNIFGRTIPYFVLQGAVAVILLLAANTPFAGFPRVASQLASDGYLPRQFRNLGSRLVFVNGVLFLSLCAIFLVYMFDGSVHALIPLYAVGVFLGFSLSQAGMVNHWKKLGSGNTKKIILNAVGGIATAIVLVVVFFSKFTHGAWMLVPAVLLIVLFMKQIKKHYREVEGVLALNGKPLSKIYPDKTMLILVSDVNRLTMYAVEYTRSFKAVHVSAFHIAFSAEDAEEIRKKWEKYFPDVPLEIYVSEHRDLTGPVLLHIKELETRWSNDAVIVVVPELVPSKWWHYFLHNQTAFRLRFAIDNDPDIHAEILEVPWKIKK